MQCPIDQTELVMTDRQGVEIDYCPKCRGVWLDRGELDKIIDRSAGGSSEQARYATSDQGRSRPMDSRDRYDDDDDDYRGGRKKKKRGSFLEDLFDFG